MIAAIRRVRQKLNAAITSWTPPQDVTMLALRPMPWELDAAGQPSERFWIEIAALAASGWCDDCGYLPGPGAGKAQLRSRTGLGRFMPFKRMLVTTQFSAFGTNDLSLSHRLCTPNGDVVATFTTRVTLFQAAPADTPVAALRSATSPSARAEEVAPAA